MADLARLRIDLSGSAVVGQSVMTFYSSAVGASLPADALTMLNSLKANFPPSLTFTVPGGGDLISENTGALTGSWTAGGGGTVTGTGVGGFAIGVGARVKWSTAGITNGRRVRGSTFLVPLMGGSFDSSGRMQPATVTSLDTPVQAFLTAQAGNLQVWSRPAPGRAGLGHDVTAATIITTPSTLRSRRT